MKMTQAKLSEILEKHHHWINQDCDEWESMRANLWGANLSGVDLCGANLWGADLSETDLHKAKLRGANLWGVDLSGANLCKTDLRGANLCETDLWRANLRGANLCGSNLYGANLYGANNIPFIPLVCPEKGSFIAFKKAGELNEYIVELEIPEDAKRTSATSRKCRCNKAKVLSITSIDGNEKFDRCCSNRDVSFIYQVGEIVEVTDFDKYRWKECSTGIHFFLSRQEAVDY